MWGVLEDHKMPPGQNVPGTVLLDQPFGQVSEDVAATLKRRGEIILSPQPSESPNDPLNWSSWKKDGAMIILGFAAAMALSMMTMLGPGFRPMSAYFHVTFDQLSTYMIGVVILLTGTTTFFSAAAASVWGKRPVFIVSILVLFLCSVWGFFATSFTSLALNRAVSGIASAPVETLVTSTVYDMYYVHERGRKLAIWGVMLLSGMHVNSLLFSLLVDRTGPLVWIPPMKIPGMKIPGFPGPPGGLNGTGPLMPKGNMSSFGLPSGPPKVHPRAEPTPSAPTGLPAGALTGHPNGVPGGIPGGLPGGAPGGLPGGFPKGLGKFNMTGGAASLPPFMKGSWQHMGIKWTFFVCMIVWVFVFLLLYFFVPETVYIRKEKSTAPETVANSSENEPEEIETKEIQVVETLRSDSSSAVEEKKSYKEELRIFQGRVTDRSFWKCVLQPLPLTVFPAVIFSTVVYGAFMALLIVLQIIQFNVLSRPPYMFRPLMLGVAGLPAWGVALVATPLSGITADWLIRKMAKRNNGIYEPEYRLWLMLPACIISTISFVCFGWAVQNTKPAAIVILFSTLQTSALPFASASSFLYVIDCHPQNSNEAFVIINLFKALVLFFASLKANGWYEHVGAKVVFNTITAMSVSISLLTIPMYIYGKRFRSVVARNKTLTKWISVTE